MNSGTKVIFISLSITLLFGILLYFHSGKSRKGNEGETLFLYCAAGIKPPIVEAARHFEKQYGVQIQFQFGGSGTLLSGLQISKTGDLYLSADESYCQLAKEKKLIAETLPLAYMTPVLAVPRGNPKKIQTLEDLFQTQIRIALGNPEAASIGKITKQLFKQNDKWTLLQNQTTAYGVFKPTVSDIVNDIKLGTVDAGIVWDSTALQHPELEIVPLPLLQHARQKITIGVLTFSKHPTLALKFARYLNSSICNPIFQAHHYQPVKGDKWAWHPEINFFSGAINRRALEPVLKQFQEREGVTIHTIYNGCGILTSQMETIKKIKKKEQATSTGFPDAYMACDRYYLEKVANWFQNDINISSSSIVIAVPKGNTHQIENLYDLTRPGLRLAIGQPQQCTIGILTRQLLQKEKIYPQIIKNVVTQTPSSALLIPALTTKSVDAAIVYQTDALAENDKIDFIPIPSPHAKAIQPYSIAESSQYQYLCLRLRNKILASKKEFEAAGFSFLQDENNVSQ